MKPFDEMQAHPEAPVQDLSMPPVRKKPTIGMSTVMGEPEAPAAPEGGGAAPDRWEGSGGYVYEQTPDGAISIVKSGATGKPGPTLRPGTSAYQKYAQAILDERDGARGPETPNPDTYQGIPNQAKDTQFGPGSVDSRKLDVTTKGPERRTSG